MRRSTLLVPVLLLALATPFAARAQAPGDPPAEPPADTTSPLDDDLAAKHSADGLAAAQKGDWQAAYTSYRAAHAIRPTDPTVGALGDAAYHLGKYREAAEYLSIYLQKTAATASPAARAAAESALADARQRVGVLTITAPVGAEVFVNHVLAGKAPLAGEVFVEPGKCDLEARSSTGEVGRQTATVEKGKSAAVTLIFGMEPAPLPTATATTTAAPTATIAPSGGPRREIQIVGASVAAGAAVVGAILLGVSRTKASDEDGLRQELSSLGKGNVCVAASRDPRCDQVKDAAGAADALTNSGAWLLIGAGVVGAATLVYSLATGKSADSRVTAAALVTPRAGGVTMSVRW